MGHLVKQATVCSLGDILDHKISLMCGAPHPQDIIGHHLLERYHETTNVWPVMVFSPSEALCACVPCYELVLGEYFAVQ